MRTIYRSKPNFKVWKGVTVYEGFKGSDLTRAALLHLSKVVPISGTVLTNSPSISGKGYTTVPLNLNRLVSDLKMSDAWFMTEEYAMARVTMSNRNKLFAYLFGMHRKFTNYVVLTCHEFNRLDKRVRYATDNLVRVRIVEDSLLEYLELTWAPRRKCRYATG